MATSKKSVDRSHFSSDDICKILESASKAGVITLSFDGLKVSFSRGKPEADQPQFLEELPSETTHEQYLEQEKERFERTKIDEMLISDPVAYEESILSGDLVDEKTQPE